mmetsp:Transcript_7351/g.17155  ORF Transcript_7351/g.17155 Transcript_7351/m.17155 type:complete len:207 (-) Transcript_7351:484-1104(-)
MTLSRHLDMCWLIASLLALDEAAAAARRGMRHAGARLSREILSLQVDSQRTLPRAFLTEPRVRRVDQLRVLLAVGRGRRLALRLLDGVQSADSVRGFEQCLAHLWQQRAARVDGGLAEVLPERAVLVAQLGEAALEHLLLQLLADGCAQRVELSDDAAGARLEHLGGGRLDVRLNERHPPTVRARARLRSAPRVAVVHVRLHRRLD